MILNNPFHYRLHNLLDFDEAYKCEQALHGTITVPAASTFMDSNAAVDKSLLLSRQTNNTSMCPLCILLTDKIGNSALYTSTPTDFPLGSASKAWKNIH
jgi:hypothetical protein